MFPRGIRANNPGNIERNNIKWNGMSEKQTDKRFVNFDSPHYGLRALMRLLLTYHYKYGLDTIECIINRWAPPCENQTDSYAYHVAKHVGARRTEPLDLSNRNI